MLKRAASIAPEASGFDLHTSLDKADILPARHLTTYVVELPVNCPAFVHSHVHDFSIQQHLQGSWDAHHAYPQPCSAQVHLEGQPPGKWEAYSPVDQPHHSTKLLLATSADGAS